MRVVIAILALWVVGMIGFLVYEQFWTGGKGAVVVMSEPPGAEIYLDLRPTTLKTAGRIERIHAGEHSVSVKLEHYLPEPFAKVVKIQSGRVDTVFFKLIPRADTALKELHAREKNSTIPERVSPATDTVLARLLAERLTEKIAATPESALPPGELETKSPDEAAPASEQPIEDIVPPPPAKEQAEAVEDRDAEAMGTIEVSSSIPGATIFVDERAIGSVTPADITLPFGTYDVRVDLADYSSDPTQQTMRVSRGNSRQFVFFKLTQKEVREILINTAPIAGEIFVDSVSVGSGSVTVPHEFGAYFITFGEVEGWKTPEPVRLTVTPAKTRPEVTGTYSRRSSVSVAVGAEGALDMSGNFTVTSGVYFEEGGFQAGGSGPRVKQIPGTQKYGWELAMGDGTKNPTGEDYVQFEFTLPDDADLATPMSLRLYGYRSPRRYPLSLSSKSVLVVTVNGKSFLPAWSPRYNTDAASADKFEEWPLERRLLPGPNRIIIRSAPENTVFHYLWKVELN